MKDIKHMYIAREGKWKSYKVFKSNGHPVHRWSANNQIYKPNLSYYREKYPNHTFSQLEVHHKNGDKLDNDIKNLQILTRKEHEDIHTDYDYGKKPILRGWGEPKHRIAFTNIPANKNKVTFYMFLFIFGWFLLRILKDLN
jgi:hypothetical protein